MAENYFGAEQIQDMIDELGGRPIIIAGVTANGLIKRADEQVLTGSLSTLLGKAVVVTVKRGTFPGIAVGAAVTVDGTAMKIHATLQTHDGATQNILCAEE